MSPDPRIHVSLEHLRRLGRGADGVSFSAQARTASALHGHHASRLRGRGLNFQEMRQYRPGEDIRAIDWKATARTGRPHVRVFSEERDRPALLIVDQRMGMFFGSRLNMKSVTAAEAAAVTAFRILKSGDRVGGIVFSDCSQQEFVPRRRVRTVHGLLESVSTMNQQLRADNPPVHAPGRLSEVLRAVARLAHHDHLVLVFSDFDGIDAQTERALATIARHNDLVLNLVHDPMAGNIRGSAPTVLSDGRLQAEIDFSSPRIRGALNETTQQRLAQIYQWQQQIRLSVLPLSAGEETLGQLRQLTTGQPASRQRVS